MLAFVLRVWGTKHSLPYVYNVDENSNFVPTAVGFFSGDYNPHYFINPPAFSYLLHGVFAVWFGGGWPFGASDAVYDAYAIDTTEVFVVARVTTALLGTAAVALLYGTGVRLYDRRVGLLAAAVLATAFLPVFYSHVALNDVPALFALMLSVYGSAGILTRGRKRDFALAGAGLGLAVATKYTAGIALLPLLSATLSLLITDYSRRRAIQGLVLAGVLAVAVFIAANPHAVLSFHEFWDDVEKQERSAGDLGKLGQTYDSGFSYYLWVFTWGLGWVPAIAAVLALPLLRHDLRRAAFLVPWPAVYLLYMGLQDRFFGRWLLPALPAVALLAAIAAVWAVDRLRTTERLRTVALAAAALLLAGQGLVYSVHLDRVLSRDDTRNLARAWMVDNVPAGAKIVVEPIVPEAWTTDPGKPKPVTPTGRRWRKFVTTRTTVDIETGRPRRGGVGRTISIEDYERTTRPALVYAYERGGFCWVVIGSTQYGRALVAPGEVPNAIPYYRTLASRGDLVHRVDPYRPGKGPVEFNFDWSFDYYPLAYERPGPTVMVYRLRQEACAEPGRS